jgi:competence protein CoiA
MFYANTPNGRARATPGATATCPTCGEDLIARCGELVAWHWAHRSVADCDPWAERDSAWHRAWQDRFPESMREVPVGPHRADIRHPDGLVVELQHSTISVDDIQARERHYGRMVWVFDATDAVDAERLDIRQPKRHQPDYATFRWRHPRKTIAACKRHVFIDLGADYGALLRLGRLYPEAPCGGYGWLVDPDDLVDDIISGRLLAQDARRHQARSTTTFQQRDRATRQHHAVAPPVAKPSSQSSDDGGPHGAA